MNSVFPTVSPVAWASYLTGRTPDSHGIHGFLERDLPNWNLYIPDARYLRQPSLWQQLSRSNVTMFAMNVPMSYPPIPIKGILIGDFLGVDLDKIAFPSKISQFLKSSGYLIDADTSAAIRGDYPAFLKHLDEVVNRRVSAFVSLIHEVDWRFAHLHIMETDRLFHFLWNSIGKPDDPLQHQINTVLASIDTGIKTLFGMMNENDTIVLMSDHGFCGIRSEVQINTLLEQHGLLIWSKNQKAGLHRIDPASKAYSLIPGRIYLNLKGREPIGSIDPADHLAISQEIADCLSTTSIGPDRIFKSILVRPHDSLEPLALPPDLIAVPNNGFDLKGKLEPADLFAQTRLQGMHTFDDAFLWVSNRSIQSHAVTIVDLYPSILNFFGIHDKETDGQVIF